MVNDAVVNDAVVNDAVVNDAVIATVPVAPIVSHTAVVATPAQLQTTPTHTYVQ